MDRPTIIAVTPVRNEAWVLNAYLACTSSWADYIILADQHSTDGSREIASRYPKVILIDNPAEEMNQAEARRLLFSEVDKIAGDKIVFAIDADEFLSPNFAETLSWKAILGSKPNSIFCLKWLNMYGDMNHALSNNDNRYLDWVCHLDSNISLADEYFKREQNAVHECRIPCLNESDCKYYMVDDISFVHLARLNLERTKNKEDFYQVSTIDKRSQSFSAISLYRMYHHHYSIVVLAESVKLLSVDGEDHSDKVRLDDVGLYYIDEIVSIVQRQSWIPFGKVDIWNNPYLVQKGIIHTPSRCTKVLFNYLKWTTTMTDTFFVKFVDKILKKFL